MLVLVTYDVSTKTPSGQKRLRQVAKACEAKGVRVQNSVFECIVDAAEYRKLQYDLEAIIDPESDSLRFYVLGNHYKNKVVHIGAKESIDVTEPLIF